jgi:hypothetical protein
MTVRLLSRGGRGGAEAALGSPQLHPGIRRRRGSVASRSNCCHSLLRDLDRPSYLTKARTKAIGCSTGINLGITSQAPCYPALPGGGVKPTVDVDWSRAWPPGVLPPVPRNDGAPRWGYEGLHRATTAALERRWRLSCGPAGTGLLGLLSWADGPRLADRCSRCCRLRRCGSGRSPSWG